MLTATTETVPRQGFNIIELIVLISIWHFIAVAFQQNAREAALGCGLFNKTDQLSL